MSTSMRIPIPKPRPNHFDRDAIAFDLTLGWTTQHPQIELSAFVMTLLNPPPTQMKQWKATPLYIYRFTIKVHPSLFIRSPMNADHCFILWRIVPSLKSVHLANIETALWPRGCIGAFHIFSRPSLTNMDVCYSKHASHISRNINPKI